MILTVHDGLDLVYWTEDKRPFILGGVDEAKPSTTQAGRGHDLPQSEALLALALAELPLGGKRDAHFRRGILLSSNVAAHLIPLTLAPLKGEYCQSSPGPQREVAQGHLGVAGESEGKAGLQAHRPQAHHLLDCIVRHLLWNNLEQA